MLLTLLKTMGTAGSFLLLVIFAAVLFGAPLILLALRLVEEIKARRRELSKRREDESTDRPDSAEQIISTNNMKNA